jgi:NAD(P)-dependent dehydrogenase (short-subunit alcohol dehydrogenase family)
MRPVAFVTGASRGIGCEAALDLARRGFDLVLAARTVREGNGVTPPSSRSGGEAVSVAGSLEHTAELARDLGASTALVPLDLLDDELVKRAPAAALKAFGRIDALVTSAIVQGPGNMDRLVDLDLDDAERLVRGDYLATLRLVQALIPPMAKRGGGVFVHVTSFAAQNDPRKPAGEGGWGVAYAAAKSAAHRIAGHVHAEFGGRGVRAYNLDPGFVVTEAIKARGTSATPIGDVNGPDRPGRVIGWLTSDDPRTTALSGRTVVTAEWIDQL